MRTHWAMVGDDDGCYVMLEEDGYVAELADGTWKWRTGRAQGVEPTRHGAMRRAEESLREDG